MADVENKTPNNEEEKTVAKRPLEEETTAETVEEPTAKKIKIDEEPATELEKKIIRQIEYYFGDINLARDKFMNEKKDEEGWIPLTVMLTFKRLQTLTLDPEVIVKALAKSETQLVQVSEDKERLRRAPEYPIPEVNDERRKELQSRTAYVKGFPTTCELDDLLNWFEDKKTENLIKRVYLDKATKKFHFKGSVFVTFLTVDDCKKFIESGPYHYDTDKAELVVKWQEAYVEEKRKERQDAKQESAKMKQSCKPEKKAFELDCSIIHLKNLSLETVRDDIKAHFLDKYQTEVRYVEHEKGETEAYLRLNGNETGGKFMEQLGEVKEVELNGNKLEVRLVEGEELDKRIEKIKEDMANSKSYQKSSKRHSKRNNGNKHKNNRKNKGRN